MPFEKVETQVDFPAQEREVLKLWDRIRAFERLREKNKNGPTWSFLDGPITANNPMGVHHAWGRTYKDAYQRYHAMNGKHLRYQNGFDCQGLWVEVEVEKALKLKSKRDIENLVEGDRFASIDKFVQECKDRVDKYARIQTDQSIRLGYWMDWDRTDEDWAKPPGERKSYFTMAEENNYTIWSFLKKCHERELIYHGYDSMPWCARCGVGLSQQEMNEGYRVVAHKAVFIRFPLRDRPNENLLVWTTTPWTLTSNVGAAVNPELTYLKVKLGDQIYYVGKGAFTAKRREDDFRDKTQWVQGVPKLKPLEQLFKEKKEEYEVVGEVKGAEMVGWAYDGPFDELDAQQHPFGFPEELSRIVKMREWAPEISAKDAHRVVAWKDVSEEEGTGIVHIAPGCGAEDFELGKEQGLPPVAPLAEDGRYLEGFGDLTGKSANAPFVAEMIVKNLQEKGVLFATEQYPHRYPHCWRCKTELLYRLVDEWFISMSWRDEIKAVVEQVQFLPESINGKAREKDWLSNMGDWMISKKRFWGLALPIWVDEETGDFEVIGSYEELKERAVKGWEEFEGRTPHRPWVDKIKIKNPKSGNLMSRIGDVGNPWLDAGIVPYSTMHYNTDRSEWEKWFPADFITECFPGQFRNWFYAILAMSTMMENRPPFKVLLGHGLVRDQFGLAMSKSGGNAIRFEEAADEGYVLETKGKRQNYLPMGADVSRWLYCRNNPAANINFGPGPADEVRQRFILKLWNTYAFFCNYARLDKFDPTADPVPLSQRQDIDRWILSDLRKLIEVAHKAFQDYNVMTFCIEAERFVDDKLSNWFVRRNRPRFWKSEKGADKDAAYQTLYAVLMTLNRLFAPIVPFLTEAMYQNMRTEKDPESVHLCDFPTVDELETDEELSTDMNALLRLVSLGSAARNSVKIRVRQPLAELKVQPAQESDRRAVERFSDQLCEELNLKTVTLQDLTNGPLLGYAVKANGKTLGPKASEHGQQFKAVQDSLAKADAGEVVKKLREDGTFELQCDGGSVPLVTEDVIIDLVAPEGWAGVEDRGTQVVLDARVTEELAREGMARDVVRQVQNLRKGSGLEMEDRIVLHLSTESEALSKAIEEHRDYVCAETLATSWGETPLEGGPHSKTVKIEGQDLLIQLKKA